MRGVCRSEYEVNLGKYHREVQEAVPRIDNLGFHGPQTVTPAVRYVLQEEIGSGAFGTVYKAFDSCTNRVYAAKTIRASYKPDEIRILQKVTHVSISNLGLDHEYLTSLG